MSILINGICSFLGSSFLTKLNQENITDIIGIDTITEKNWKNLNKQQFIDVYSKDHFTELNDDIKCVININSENNNDMQFSKNLCSACYDKNIKFINISSFSTYGNGENGFSDDIMPPKLKPLNYYAYNKNLFDNWLFRKGYLDKVINIKPFNVFGPNEYHKQDYISIIFKIYRSLKDKNMVSLYQSIDHNFKDGDQCRDYIYIKDFNQHLFNIMNNDDAHGIINIGSGVAKSFKDLVNYISLTLNIREYNIQLTYLPIKLHNNYPHYIKADVSKLNQYSDHVCLDLNESIYDYINNYLSYNFKYLNETIG